MKRAFVGTMVVGFGVLLGNVATNFVLLRVVKYVEGKRKSKYNKLLDKIETRERRHEAQMQVVQADQKRSDPVTVKLGEHKGVRL